MTTRRSRKREFPVDIPEYIKTDAVKWGVGEISGEIWIMRSEYERRQANRLIQAGVLFVYEHIQIEYWASVHNGVCFDCRSEHIGSRRLYTPDFYFPETGIYAETKGKFDSQNRTKMKNIVDQSDADVRMVFMRDNYLTKKRKMTYGRWCDLNNMKYTVGDIPFEWGVKE